MTSLRPCGPDCVLRESGELHPLGVSARSDGAWISGDKVIRRIAERAHDPGHPFFLDGTQTVEMRADALRQIADADPAHVLSVEAVCRCSFRSPLLEGEPLQDFGLGPDGDRLIHPADRRLERGPGAIETLLSQLAEGLSSLHELGVVHGDPAIMNAFVSSSDGGDETAVWVDLNSAGLATPESVAVDVAAFSLFTLLPALVDATYHSPSLFEDVTQIVWSENGQLVDIVDALVMPRSDHVAEGSREDLQRAITSRGSRGGLVGEALERISTASTALYFLDYTGADQNARFFNTLLRAEQTRHQLLEEERTRLHHLRFSRQIAELQDWTAKLDEAVLFHSNRAAELDEAVLSQTNLTAEAEARTAEAEARTAEAEARTAETELRISSLNGRIDDLERGSSGLRDDLNEVYESRAWRSVSRLRSAKTRLGTAVRTRSLAPPPESSEFSPQSDSGQGPEHYSLAGFQESAVDETHASTVSVIMPVYNKGEGIQSSIDSLLDQTLQDFEIVIWDDGSTDETTLQVLEDVDLLDRVTVIHTANRGVIAARNSAMRLAQGEFLVCLDPDDRFQPTYLEKAVLFLRAHPEISIVYPWQKTIGAKHERWETADLDPAQIAAANHVPVCAMFRPDLLTETGGFSAEMSGGVEDWELWVHAAELGFSGRVIRESLFEYWYSDDPSESRDATARDHADELADRIRTLHPTVATARPRPAPNDAVPNRISLPPPAIPAGTGHPVIIFVPWFTVGGADRVVKELVNHWASQGRTVVAITTLGVVSGMEDRLDDLLELTPYVYQLPNILPMHLWYQFVDRVLTALPEASILNIGSTWFHDHAAKLKRSHPGIRIVDQQFNDSGHIEGNQIALPAIDLTVTAYEGLRSSFLADGRPDETVANIYVGIEPAEVGAEDLAATMEEIGLGSGRPYVAFVGRLSEEKRPEWLFPLADTLHGRGVDVVVVGSGPLAKRLGDDLDTHPGIAWIQHVEDTAPVFAGAEATVLPSRIEGIPLTAMESLAVGTPVVATAVGGLPELEDVAGVHLVDPDDRLAFIKATTAVLDTSPHESISLPDELTLHGMIERYDALIDPSP